MSDQRRDERRPRRLRHRGHAAPVGAGDLGKEVVRIRDDDLLLEQTFFDQDGKPVKRLSAQAIGMLGGRRYVTRLRMAKLEAADEWTELDYRDARFDLDLPDGLFTQSNLRNPRPQWERPPK